MKTLCFSTEAGFEFVEKITTVTTTATKAKYSEIRETVKWYSKGTSILVKDMDLFHIDNVLKYLLPMRLSAFYKTMSVRAWTQILIKEIQYRDDLRIIEKFEQQIHNAKHRLDNL